MEHGYLRDKTDEPPPEDLKEVAGLIGLTLPPSYASWLEVRLEVVVGAAQRPV